MPHFSQAGWDCYAVSLRGQGGSKRPEGVKSGGSLASHAADLHSVVGSLPRAPVIIAHSFGGLLAQRCGVWAHRRPMWCRLAYTSSYNGLWGLLAQSGGSLGLRQESMATRSLELACKAQGAWSAGTSCGAQLLGRPIWLGLCWWQLPHPQVTFGVVGTEVHVSLHD